MWHNVLYSQPNVYTVVYGSKMSGYHKSAMRELAEPRNWRQAFARLGKRGHYAYARVSVHVMVVGRINGASVIYSLKRKWTHLMLHVLLHSVATDFSLCHENVLISHPQNTPSQKRIYIILPVCDGLWAFTSCITNRTTSPIVNIMSASAHTGVALQFCIRKFVWLNMNAFAVLISISGKYACTNKHVSVNEYACELLYVHIKYRVIHM